MILYETTKKAAKVESNNAIYCNNSNEMKKNSIYSCRNKEKKQLVK